MPFSFEFRMNSVVNNEKEILYNCGCIMSNIIVGKSFTYTQHLGGNSVLTRITLETPAFNTPSRWTIPGGL